MELQPLNCFNALGVALKEKFIRPFENPLQQLNQFWCNQNNQTPFNWDKKVDFVQFEIVKGEVKEYSLVSDTLLSNSRDIHVVVFPYNDYSKDDFLVLLDCRTENGMSFLF